jgi:hypothetical protein
MREFFMVNPFGTSGLNHKTPPRLSARGQPVVRELSCEVFAGQKPPFSFHPSIFFAGDDAFAGAVSVGTRADPSTASCFPARHG